MSDDIVFDNFIIGDDKSIIDQWTADTWEIKHALEMAGGSSGVGGCLKSSVMVTKSC